MFRIEKKETINKNFRFPVELIDRLAKLAKEKGISLNNLVNQCCEYALKNLEDINK